MFIPDIPGWRSWRGNDATLSLGHHGRARVSAAWVIVVVMIAYAARTLDGYEPCRPVRWQV
ncbi:hypothetical protein GCM10009548_73420 [Streptomyces malaysiensis subsp. malaysiensis]